MTFEMVSKGHPDKVADLISDMVADYIVKKDPDYHTAIEVLLKDREVIVAGEATIRPSNYALKSIVKDAFVDAGYKYRPKIRNLISRQSPDINRGVLTGGAGDQGIVYGYATNESASYLPKGYFLASRLMSAVDGLRKDSGFIKADGKCEIITDKKGSVKKVIVSKQNTDEKQTQKVITDVIRSFPAMKTAEILINPTGKFEIGGPFGDCGLTGRKISVDTYGGAARHGGGCVDKETEVLTPQGWKKIAAFDEKTDKIAQWNSGELEFVSGEFVKLPKTKMYRIKSQSVDMVLSDSHNVLYITSKGNEQKKTLQEILDHFYKTGGARGIQIPLAFTYNFSQNGLSMSDDEIRLQIAFCADGAILPESSKKYRGRIRVKKEYKKAALRKLLESTRKEDEWQESKYKDGYSIFYYTPAVVSKRLCDIFTGCSRHQAEIIAEEAVKWDGDRKSTFRTTSKEDANFIQFIFSSVCGASAGISVDDRIGEKYNGEYTRKSICYTVYQVKRKFCTPFRTSGVFAPKTDITLFDDGDKYMYCVNVPSHNLILRRSDKIFVTGNCLSGKDFTKVDRSGAYFARMLAVEAVKKGLGDKIEISLSFAIGRPEIQEAVCTYCEKGSSVNSSVDINKVNQWLAKRLEKTTVDSMIKEVRKVFSGPLFSYTDYGHFTGVDWSKYPDQGTPKKPPRRRQAKKEENGGK